MGAPLFIGLTGGVAAGKSEALAAFARQGAATISSDEVVHELLGERDVRERLVRRWGRRVAPQGEVDRGRVGEIVFASPDELQWLEAELHPGVARRLVSWRNDLPPDTELAVAEVPLLFEAGMEDVFDAVVCVVASEETRERRAREKGMGGLEGRSGRQLNQDEKAARATHVISNDTTLADLEAAIAHVMAGLSGDGGQRAART